MDFSYFNVLSIVLGICCIVFNKYMARGAVEFYKKTIHKEYNESSYKFGFYFGGTFFLIIGVLGLFNRALYL